MTPPGSSQGEQGARVLTAYVCPNDACDPMWIAAPCNCIIERSHRRGTVTYATRVPVEVVPREVPPATFEAAARAYQFGVYPGDESEATEEEIREMTRAVLTAAGLLVSGAVTEEENADG